MTAFFKRTATGLAPDGDEAATAMRGIKIGEIVAVEIKRPRNMKHLRLYWALVSHIANAIDVEPESISDVLKLKTGHFVTVNTKSGPLQFPRSISFAKMDQAAFGAFFERCCRVICTEWVPGMSSKQLQDEVLEFMGVHVK